MHQSEETEEEKELQELWNHYFEVLQGKEAPSPHAPVHQL